MLVGNLSFLVIGLTFLLVPVTELGTWSAVAPLYMVYGLGRAVWESVNKAIHADFFPGNPSAAFARCSFLNRILHLPRDVGIHTVARVKARPCV
jgi:hypothetical protein